MYESFDSIEKYTLQTYFHALSFTPKDTVLYKTYFVPARKDFCVPNLVIGAKWDACLRTIGADDDIIHCTATSPKLPFIALGTSSGSLIVCHLQSGATIATLQAGGGDSPVRGIIFLSDGRLRAGFEDGTIATWDADMVLGSQCEQGTLGAEFLCMVFSEDGSFVSALVETGPEDENRILRVWTLAVSGDTHTTSISQLDTTVMADLQTAKFAGYGGMCFAFSPSGSHIAFAPIGLSTLYIHYIQNHSTLTCTSRCIQIPLSGNAWSVAWSHAGDRVACATANGFAIYTVNGIQSWVSQALVIHLSFSPDDHILVTVHENSGILLWRLEGSQLETPPPLPGSSLQHYTSSIVLSEDGARVISDHVTNVKVWDARTGSSPTPSISAESADRDVTYPVTFSPDGEWLATRSKSHDHIFYIWDTNTGKRIFGSEDEDGGGKVHNLLWISVGTMKRLVVCREASAVLYDLHVETSTTSVLHQCRLDSDFHPWDFACSPDGSYLLLGCHHRHQKKGKLFVFDLTSEATEPVFTHARDGGGIFGVAWSSNDLIAYGGDQFTYIFSWRRPTSSIPSSPDQVPLQDGDYFCRLLSFSPDGAWLAAYSNSYRGDVIFVYDVQTRECLREIPFQSRPINIFSFSSDGTEIYTDSNTCNVSDLHESQPNPGTGVVSRRGECQRRIYCFSSDDQRWIVDQEGRRACRLPPLGDPRMTTHVEKVAVWDDSGRFFCLCI